MGNSKSIYTEEDKAIYKMAMATRLQMKKSNAIGNFNENRTTGIGEIINKLKHIASKLENSSKFSDTLQALDIQLEIDLLGILARYERGKIIENKSRLLKSRNEAISKLAYINQLCEEAEEIYSRGQKKLTNGDYESAASDYKHAVAHFNNSHYLISKLTGISDNLSSHASTISKLTKVKTLLKTVCLLSPNNNTLTAKTSIELRTSEQSINYKETIENKDESHSPIFDKDLFTNTIDTIRYNKQTISTNFTDEQAVTICSKMSDSYARHVANKYQQFSNHVQGAIYRYQLHYLANKALALYGGPILTFLLGLRALKFNNHSAYVINFQKPNSDISYLNVDFPALTFTTLKGDKYTLAFHFADNSPIHKAKKSVRIFKKSLQVGSIDTKGYVLDIKGNYLKKLSSTSSSLLTFCCFLATSKSPAFYSGVETGNCFVCNRQLTDPVSVRYGIGPVCLGKVID